MPVERLQKILAAAGLASRRKSEELITSGRVSVNGEVVTELGTKADPRMDEIRVDGELLRGPERHVYIMLYKPKGHVTTVSDPEGRPTVMELISGVKERVFPVGRLDYMSEGLLLMTNDGELMEQLTRAGSHVPKTYMVKSSGHPTEEDIEKLRQGIVLPPEPGMTGVRGKKQPGVERRSFRVRTQPARVELAVEQENPWYSVTLIEGRNRQIRRMFEQIGHHVEKIKRVQYGPLELDVEPGQWRLLSPKEITLLRTSIGKPFDASSPKRRENRKGFRTGERKPQGRFAAGRSSAGPRKEFHPRPTGERGARPRFARDSRGPAGPDKREGFAARSERPERAGFDRPARPSRDDRGERPRFDRGERPERPRREGERPAFKKSAGLGQRSERPERRPRTGRPGSFERSERPRREGTAGKSGFQRFDRPRSERPSFGDRPKFDRKPGAGAREGFSARGPRPERPRFEREDRASRPAGAERGPRQGGGRPPRKEWGSRPAKPGFGAGPSRSGKGKFGSPRSSGPRSDNKNRSGNRGGGEFRGNDRGGRPRRPREEE